MYCCTATRPDLAYAVHQHCRALSRPTPELVAELRISSRPQSDVFAHRFRRTSIARLAVRLGDV
eukprot:scaffold58456_cov30-Phaeocystis_antarctica.AAC.2